jgi:hypothetical protein
MYFDKTCYRIISATARKDLLIRRTLLIASNSSIISWREVCTRESSMMYVVIRVDRPREAQKKAFTSDIFSRV